MRIDAVVISVGEPQLRRCLDSVAWQTVRFNSIVHIDNVVPQAVALRAASEKVTADWFMLLGGDMVLLRNAVAVATSYIEGESGGMGAFHFGLWDGFARLVIPACKVIRAEPFRRAGVTDRLDNDYRVQRRMERNGWPTERLWKKNVILGSHFEDPDDFQVFRRYMIAAIKERRSAGKSHLVLRDLHERTGDGRYALAMRAYEFGRTKEYAGSHNLDYDRQMYQEFKLKEASHG